MTRAPIFIGGYLRSGTTLLRYLIDSHPNLACGPESEIFVLDARPCIEGIFESGRYDTYLKPNGISEDDVYDMFGRQPIRQFFARLLERTGKPRWADKCPVNCKNFDFLGRCFPDAYFVQIIRDGRDCICSLNDVDWYGNTLDDKKPLIEAAMEWSEWVSKGRADGGRLEHYLELRYEDLVREPRSTMQTFLDFVGEPWSDAVLIHHERDYAFERGLDPRNREGASAPVNRHSVGQWKQRMSRGQLRAFDNAAGALLRELGYEPSR